MTAFERHRRALNQQAHTHTHTPTLEQQPSVTTKQLTQNTALTHLPLPPRPTHHSHLTPIKKSIFSQTHKNHRKVLFFGKAESVGKRIPMNLSGCFFSLGSHRAAHDLHAVDQKKKNEKVSFCNCVGAWVCCARGCAIRGVAVCVCVCVCVVTLRKIMSYCRRV